MEWKTLGEVGTFVRGTSFQKKHFVEKGIGCIHYGEIYTRYGLFAKRTISYLNEEIANKARKAAYGDLIIATTSENDDDVCKSTVWLGTESIVVSNDACYYHHTLNPKYVAYFFRTNEFQKQKRAYITGTKVKRVNANDLAKITIPVPPLRVQARIVEILDKFTQLEAELEAELESELEARKKQYAYYRDQLLNFSQCPPLNVNIEWKTLGEVCHIVGRIGFRGYTRNDIVERGEGAISISPTNIINQHLNLSAEINTYISWEKYDESPEIKIEIGDIVLVKTGSTVGKTAIVRELIEKATINPQMVVLKEIQCSPAYLSHYINTPYFQLKLKSLCGQGSVPNISQTKLSTIPIPLPPLSEQRRIVDILDRFDTLTNSISEGLPKEIALRRKQYEYYRDALLNFPRAEVTA